MDIEQYFNQPDTPAKDSPVGVLIVRIMGKFPASTFEQARAKARDLLAVAAGKRRYVLPAVLSDEEAAERRAAGKAYWESRRLKVAA